jgi:hypothetical protein
MFAGEPRRETTSRRGGCLRRTVHNGVVPASSTLARGQIELGRPARQSTISSSSAAQPLRGIARPSRHGCGQKQGAPAFACDVGSRPVAAEAVREVGMCIDATASEDGLKDQPLLPSLLRRVEDQRLFVASEHMLGEQNGEQNEQNWEALSVRKPKRSGAFQLIGTPSLRLGAGRSQVQILSPR